MTQLARCLRGPVGRNSRIQCMRSAQCTPSTSLATRRRSYAARASSQQTRGFRQVRSRSSLSATATTWCCRLRPSSRPTPHLWPGRKLTRKCQQGKPLRACENAVHENCNNCGIRRLQLRYCFSPDIARMCAPTTPQTMLALRRSRSCVRYLRATSGGCTVA